MTYPTISHLIESLTGFFIPLPIQTFGFFIVLAFITGAYFIKAGFLKLEKEKIFKPISVKNKKNKMEIFFDYFINGLMAFFFGYKIIYIQQNYSLFSESPQSVLLSHEGNIIIGLGCLVTSVIYIYYSNKKIEPKTIQILPSQLSWNFMFVAAISGIIGAKLFAVLEDIPYLLQNPISALFSFSGLTFYGGLIIGTICVILYAKKHQISIPRLADVFAPALILAYGIGRLGCHFSGDGDWGIISNMSNKPFLFPDWFWGYNFPHNVIETGVKIEDCIGKYCHELPYLVYPTSLYEASFGIIAFLFLWYLRKYISTPGILFCIYLILNGLERFLIEFIRVTDKYNIVGLELTQAQVIAILLIITGSVGVFYLKKEKNLNEFI